MKGRVTIALLWLWQSPVLVPVWLFYILPLWLISHDFKFVEWTGGVALFEVQSKRSWYAKLWRDWAGCALPGAIVTRQKLPSAVLARTLYHEFEHVVQWAIYGALFPLLYWGESFWIWLLEPDRHAYLDNMFEVAARRAAGQQVHIPREQWPQGPDDRWPWW